MLELFPEATRLSESFQQAAAPTFFLGAVAAFASLLSTRINGIFDRARTLTAISEDDLERAYLKKDLDRLMRRARLLKDALLAVLTAGVFATLLLAVLFVSALFAFKYAFGAGLLFLLAILLLSFALLRFAQEAYISIGDADKY
jgi:hypothetical protein